jgi:hypothetical protein
MLRFKDALRQSARAGNHNDEMRILARHNGINVMQECALDLVRDGLTTFEEVQRVVAVSQITSETCGSCARELSPNFAFLPFCGSNGTVGICRCLCREARTNERRSTNDSNGKESEVKQGRTRPTSKNLT